MRLSRKRPAPPVVPADLTPRPARLWSDRFGTVATRSLQIIAVLVFVAILVLVLTQLSLVFIPITIALILASAIRPLMAWMERRGMPSMLAAWTAMVSILVVVGGIVWLIVEAVRDEWDELASSAVEGVSQLREEVAHLPFAITDEQFDELQGTLADFVTSSQFSLGALAGVSAAASFLTGLVLMIFTLFFFLKDGPRIWEFILRPFTGKSYERARRIGHKTVNTLGDYVRGTAIVAAADAVGIGLGLFILQVPLALPLAVVVFLTAFIPLVGATAAGILAALVALVSLGWVEALIVIGIVIVVNQLEGNLLQPVLMGRSLKLHPLVILFALTIGTVLAGIVGAVLAVPMAAVAWGIVSVWNGEDTPAHPAQQKRQEAT